jgi:putative ABC transport system permease protein
VTETVNITYWSLAAGYLLLIAPLFFLYYYRTGLLKDAVIALLRMTLQLLAVGIYLEFLFSLNHWLVNTLWVLVMITISTIITGKRSSLPIKTFFLPLFVSLIIVITTVNSYFLGTVIGLSNIFDARYFIPITGMMLGNSIKTIIIALNDYYGNLMQNKTEYQWYLANGANFFEARMPFLQRAFQKAFNPVIATTAIVGLVSLPGMMTGQILGGNSPVLAVKYQIMLMITIFTISIVSVVIALFLSDKKVFTALKNLDETKLKP